MNRSPVATPLVFSEKRRHLLLFLYFFLCKFSMCPYQTVSFYAGKKYVSTITVLLLLDLSTVRTSSLRGLLRLLVVHDPTPSSSPSSSSWIHLGPGFYDLPMQMSDYKNKMIGSMRIHVVNKKTPITYLISFHSPQPQHNTRTSTLDCPTLDCPTLDKHHPDRTAFPFQYLLWTFALFQLFATKTVSFHHRNLQIYTLATSPVNLCSVVLSLVTFSVVFLTTDAFSSLHIGPYDTHLALPALDKVLPLSSFFFPPSAEDFFISTSWISNSGSYFNLYDLDFVSLLTRNFSLPYLATSAPQHDKIDPIVLIPSPDPLPFLPKQRHSALNQLTPFSYHLFQPSPFCYAYTKSIAYEISLSLSITHEISHYSDSQTPLAPYRTSIQKQRFMYPAYYHPP